MLINYVCLHGMHTYDIYLFRTAPEAVQDGMTTIIVLNENHRRVRKTRVADRRITCVSKKSGSALIVRHTEPPSTYNNKKKSSDELHYAHHRAVSAKFKSHACPDIKSRSVRAQYPVSREPDVLEHFVCRSPFASRLRSWHQC